jgi:hypothetical protein
MSPAFLVASILAIGWNLVIAALVGAADTTLFGEMSGSDRGMDRWLRSVRAEVGTLEFDVRSGRSERQGASSVATNRVRSDVGKTSCEVQVEAPYAAASVPVATDESTEQRRCRVCLN